MLHIFKRVENIMSSDIVQLSKDKSVDYALRLMIDKKVGLLPIMNNNSNLVGIVTQSDILKRSILDGKDPKRIKLDKIMSTPPITVSPKSTMHMVSEKMKKYSVKRFPVVQEDHIIGVVTRADLVNSLDKSLYLTVKIVIWLLAVIVLMLIGIGVDYLFL